MTLSQDSLKRDHDSFLDLANLEKPFAADSQFEAYHSQSQIKDSEDQETSMPTPPVSVESTKRDPSPATLSRRSSTTSLTDAGSATPSRGGSPMPVASPSAFAALNGQAPPAAKRPKLTFQEREQEREMKRIEKEIRDQERAAERAKREAERAKKEAEKQVQAEEKARKDAEKAAEKARKEAERQAQAEEKARREAVEKAAREEKKRLSEEKKRLKEEEKQKAEEEKRKKERNQKKLNSFFNIPATARRNSVDGRSSTSPAPSSGLGTSGASPAAATPGRPERSAYDKLFPSFFVKENVTMAPINRFERDEEGSEALQRMIDTYIIEDRSPGRQRDFNASMLFHLSGHGNVARGKRYMAVREIMTEFSSTASRPIDLTTDSQNTQIRRTNDLLKKIPMKFLKFQEDVRPPYRGTYTSRPVHGITKLARNPLRRDLPDTNYDYDSEAEWVEDEDAEDLNSEGEEEDADVEDGEDMDGFLDDEGDESANSKRLVIQGDLEPISTGLCWEDQHKRSTNVKMMPYRMEIIMGKEIMLDKIKSIDPFSTHYWESTPSKSMEPPRLPLNALKPHSSTFNASSTPANTKPVTSFFTTGSDLLKLNPSQPHPSTQHPPGTNKPEKPKKLLPDEDMESFRNEVRGSDLSKVGLIEVLKKKFPGRTGAQVKATVEQYAKRVGAKEVEKRWVLVDETAV